MTVLVHTLDGLMRLRTTNKAETVGVVELRSHVTPGSWTWCVYRSLPIDRAWDLFENQARFHMDPTVWFTPIVQPGI